MTTLPSNGHAKVLRTEMTEPQRPRWGSLNGLPSATLGVYDSISKVEPGTYATYRQMRANPTLAMARAAALGPIKAAGHSFEAKDGTPDERVAFIQEAIDPLWHRMIGDVLRAVEYGWAGFEKVYAVREGRYVYEKLKALLPDTTDILTDDHGNFTGLAQGEVEMHRDKTALYTYDEECGNLYGRSRNENVREAAWSPWINASKQLERYMAKGAGIIPLLRYPYGVVQTTSGDMPTHDVARKLLNELGSGKGIAFPWQFPEWAEKLLDKGVDPAQLQSWALSFLEHRAGVGSEILDALKYYDTALLRGWLVPERAVIEGQHGTKAEAESHGDIAVMVAQDTYREIVADFVNAQLIDPLLRMNFGREAVGSVYAVASPLTSEEREFFRRVVESVMTNPGNIDILVETTDLDAMLDSVGWPKAQEVVTVTPPAPAPAPTLTVPNPAAPLTQLMRAVYRKKAKRK